jgi:two-component system, OmpR family, response regulator
MAAMLVLVVEDNRKMADLIRRVLLAERVSVEVAPDGATGVGLATDRGFDVIVLDRLLPDLEGTEVLRILRSRGISTPVLMLTALGSVDHRVSGLNAGADDYLTKPFAFAELLARIHALARRPARDESRRPAVGDLILDEERHLVRVGDHAADLSAREFALLGFFMRHVDQVLTRRQILDAVWGSEPDVYSNVVDLYVHYLRRKLAELRRSDMLRTVRGVGYVLRAPA